jgi:L-malate glycosyltransferase
VHILVIPSWYSTPTNPVRGSFFREQALALQKAGHQVGVLVPPTRVRTWHGLTEVANHWWQSNTEIAVENDSGLMTYRISWWGWRPLVSLSARGALTLEVFKRYCREYGTPDIIHAHSALYGGYIGAWIGKHTNTPVVLTEHGTFIVQGTILPGQGDAIRYALRHSAKRLTVGQSLVDALRRYAPELDYEILGNSIDTDFFVPGKSIPSRPPFMFSVVAHLYAKKRIDVLLRAFAQAFTGQSVLLKIGGDGKERAKLERLARELNLDQQVTFLGRLSREQVRELIWQSHAVVSSSHIETFGVTIAEAMACGKPVVATRSGGPESFVDERSGLLVERDNVPVLASAMQQMVDNHNNYNPAQIRALCVSRFSEQAIIQRLESIYAEVLGDNR